MEAVANHDFRATQPDELSFSKGTTVKVYLEILFSWTYIMYPDFSCEIL